MREVSVTVGSGAVLVRQKIALPGLPAAAILRPRLTQLYSALLDEHEVLAVFAAAGSGKTVQAQLFAAAEGWPLAWLTLDRADHSATRLLAYLAATLEPHTPGARAALDEAVRRTPAVEEQAAILAEHVAAQRLLLVLDQCEAIADAERSCQALQAFLDYLPGGVHVMLLSRSEMSFSLSRQLLSGRAGRITDEDLALTLDEALELVGARGDHDPDVRDRWQQSRGWIAAVAFGGPRRPGGHDRARDFRSYMTHEVIEGLGAEERRFLLDTSILDAVTNEAAAALCGPESLATLAAVRMRHLPATTSEDAIVYHPCLRMYLRDQLAAGDPDRMRMLQQRQSQLLLAREEYEEAVDLLIGLDLLDEAAAAAEPASRELLARGDWEKFLIWVDEIGDERVRARPLLLGGLIRALRGGRHLRQARELARELDRGGRLPEVIAADPGAIAHVAWSMLWAPIEGLDFLDRYDHDQRAVGVRYMLEATSLDRPVLAPTGVPWTETDRLISWALMVQGRLDDLLAMLPTDDQWPPRTPYTTPHPLFGLVWRGELQRARELYEQASGATHFAAFSDLWHYLEAWLLLAEGRPAEAANAAELAVIYCRQTHFGFEPVFQIVQAMALAGLGEIREALALADEACAKCEETGHLAYLEWGLTVRGRALLMRGDTEEAAADLRRAVAGMTHAERLLMLPLAGVYLAEAERRLGDLEACDAAAAIAYEASLRMGAFPALQMGLNQFPEVLNRQLKDPDQERWRRISITGPTSVVSRPLTSSRPLISVEIQPFGPHPDIVVGGVPAGVRRLKVLELACLLTAHAGGVNRSDLQVRLFPESDRRKGSNHFRQVVHQLRKATTLTLQRVSDSRVAWPDEFVVDAADLRFERAVVQAKALTGRERLERLSSARGLLTGLYLEASDLEWCRERRYRLDVVQEEAGLEIARLALELHEYDLARTLSEEMLERNPYLDEAYRALIEIELAIGSESAARAVYRRSVESLRELGLSPDRRMAQLLNGTG